MVVANSLNKPWLEVGQHLLQIGGIALGLIVLAHIGSFIYNIYFSPLRSYPGPKLWAGTRLFEFWHQTRGSLIHKVHGFHEKYGPVVRIAPTEISYITASAWKEIYGHRSVEMPKVMDGRGGILPSPNGVHTILTAPRGDHSRIRRNVSHAFSAKALQEQESYVQTYVDLLLKGIKDESADGTPQNMLNWYNFTTFDVIGDLAFGEPFGCLEDNQYHSWITSIFRGIQSNPWLQFGIHYRLSKAIMTLLIPKELVQARLRNYKIAGEKMDRRLANPEDRKDFTSYMVKHNDEKGLSTAELRAMATTLIIAGSETSATLLTGVTYHMLKRPSVYERLTKEIRDKFSKEEDITFVSTGELTYLAAVLEEGLRIYPPVPVVLPRVVPEGGEEIEGKYVPGGTAVGVPQYATYHSTANFHLPEEFHPERFLPESEGGSKEFANDNKDAFQPFSFGPRACLGRNLAYSEMKVILARLLFKFDLRLGDTDPNWHYQFAPLLWIKQPLNVHVTERKME
ncbi:MAG: hypothetical protein M1831_001602 [Alyxoria varia]|nr:MAG: hypothetical protein M1831_001602 [Alyxoria varia]